MAGTFGYNAPSVGILSCSKNQVDARDKNIQQRAKSFSLAGATGVGFSTDLPGLIYNEKAVDHDAAVPLFNVCYISMYPLITCSPIQIQNFDTGFCQKI